MTGHVPARYHLAALPCATAWPSPVRWSPKAEPDGVPDKCWSRSAPPRPVSRTFLKARRSRVTTSWPDSPNSFAMRRAHDPAGGSYRISTTISVPLSPGRRPESHVSSGVYLATRKRAPGDQLVGAVFHGLCIPLESNSGRSDGGPVGSPLIEYLNRLEMAHEAREVLEVPPEAVDLTHGTAYRNPMLDPDAGTRLDHTTGGVSVLRRGPTGGAAIVSRWDCRLRLLAV